MNRSAIPKATSACALGLALALLAGAGRAAADDRPAAGRPVDVVLCLDTSNSMDGLIVSAKTKLWDIVNELARAKPTPNLRVALYSYGNDHHDRNAGWVRKELDLTTDLDAISQKLFGLTTRGGTEYVARVCRDALEQQPWSDDKDALRIIFVCGNEPASQDREVSLKDVAALAARKDVIINPIYCGPAEHSDARDWKEFAVLTNGKFANIDQDRGTVAIATPLDKELAELSARLSTTYVSYGMMGKDRAANQVVQDANAAQLGAAVAADRAVSKASGLYRNADWDLVDRLKADPKFDVKKVPEAELSEAMRKLTPEQREAHVRKMLTEREALQKRIAELSQQRSAYLAAERKKNPSKADQAFDEAIRRTLREQAGGKGIQIPD